MEYIIIAICMIVAVGIAFLVKYIMKKNKLTLSNELLEVIDTSKIILTYINSTLVKLNCKKSKVDQVGKILIDTLEYAKVITVENNVEKKIDIAYQYAEELFVINNISVTEEDKKVVKSLLSVLIKCFNI